MTKEIMNEKDLNMVNGGFFCSVYSPKKFELGELSIPKEIDPLPLPTILPKSY